jgi:hypothetical protein
MMSGEPGATYASQRQPYVKHSVNGQYYDVNRMPTSRKSAAAHIPFGQYKYWTNN